MRDIEDGEEEAMRHEPEQEPAMDVDVEDEEVLLSLYDPPEVQDEE